jgi:hypothetical protein
VIDKKDDDPTNAPAQLSIKLRKALDKRCFAQLYSIRILILITATDERIDPRKEVGEERILVLTTKRELSELERRRSYSKYYDIPMTPPPPDIFQLKGVTASCRMEPALLLVSPPCQG